MTELREEARRVREDLIIDATISLINTKDYHEITIREISKTVGISASTIYQYFSDLYELFTRSFLKMFERFYKELQWERVLSSPNALEELASLIVDFYSSNDEAFQVYIFVVETISRQGGMHPAFRERFDHFIETNVQLFQSIGLTGDVKSAVYVFYTSIIGVIIAKRQDVAHPSELKEKALPPAILIARHFRLHSFPLGSFV
jgi:AcrR family transcriptional regulator